MTREIYDIGTRQTTNDTGYTPPTPVAISASDVRAEASRRLMLIGAPYSAEERETWAQQVDEAHAYQADNAATTPILSGIATGRGVTVADMVTIVLGNAAAFATAAGAILGKQAAILALDPIPADYAADSRWS